MAKTVQKMKDVYDLESEDEGDEEVNHEKLLKLFGVDKKADQIEKNVNSQRSEPSQDVSIFPIGGDNDKISTSQLLTNLNKTANLDAIRTQINRVEKSSQHLKPALPKIVSDRIERIAAYDKTTKDISKWDSVITQNRRAEQLSFPLSNQGLKLDTMDDFVAGMKPKTPLEMQIYEMLNGSKFVERKNHDLSIAEEEALNSMSLEEAKLRRAELQKHRALMSYHESKNNRRKKIKSKSFRRIQRKQKEKKEEAELERLEKEDPEAAAEKIKKALMVRAEERAGMRHKQGSKWARKRRLMGKYDEMSRLQLSEQSKIHKDLTSKPAVVEEGDEDVADSEEEKEKVIGLAAPTADIQHYEIPKGNPWLRHNETTEKIQDSNSETVEQEKDTKLHPLTKITNEKSSSDEEDDVDSESELKEELKELKDSINKQKEEDDEKINAFKEAFASLQQEEKKINNKEDDEDSLNDDDETIENTDSNAYEDELNVSLKRIHTLKDADDLLKESSNGGFKGNVKDQKKSEKEVKVYIDPNKVFTLPTKASEHGSGLGNDNTNKMTMLEAFTDDDVVNQFMEDKSAVAEEEKPKMEDSELPGWGVWAGAGVLPKTKKFKSKNKKADKKKVRKDDHLGHVIINEQHDISVAKYQVNDVPYPFTSQQQYEQSIRQPIGSTWNSPNTVQKLTKPKIITKLGTIIEPISAEEAFSKDRKRVVIDGDKTKGKRKKKS